MKALHRLLVALLLPSIGIGEVAQADDHDAATSASRREYAGHLIATQVKRPQVRLEKLPQITPPRSMPVRAAEAEKIRRLIRQLAEIDSPDFGFAPTLSGTAFAPVADTESAGAMVLTNPGINRSTAFTKLVTLGPRALPFLLQAVDDSTPTRFTIQFKGSIIEWMEFAEEIPGSPANSREESLLMALSKPDPGHMGQKASPYTVTVGDVCFVAIGQIVGRPYQAVHYQPTGGVIVNSPTYDPAIARTVRAIWSSDNPSQHLLDSLLLDYSTRGIHNGGKDAGFDDWDVGASPQVPATMRLLFYYPSQTAPMIAARLDKLQVQSVRGGTADAASDAEMDGWEKRELANEVRTDEFLKAVFWCREPEIQKAMRSVFERAGDPDLLLACTRALNSQSDWPLVRGKMAPILIAQPRDTRGSYGYDCEMLVALRTFGGDKARPIFRQYLENASPKCCFTVCEALEPTDGKWDREFLFPMLSDKRPGDGRNHPVNTNTNDPRLPIRVCDVAFETIMRHCKDANYSLAGSNEELDRQITAMQKAFATQEAGPTR